MLLYLDWYTINHTLRSTLKEIAFCSQMIQEPRNDPPTLIKCLTIFCNIVECSEVEELTPALQTLHDNLILSCLRSEDPAVRNIAVQALGLLCLLSKDLAKQHITLLMQVCSI